MPTDDFIVIDTERGGYVESIDHHDGDVEITAFPDQALIFRGPEWREFWARPRYLQTCPMSPAMIATTPVRRMRELQREFFGTPPKNRRPSLISEAKEAERVVDRMLDGRPQPASQPELF